MAELEPAAMTERVLRLGRVPPLNHLTTAEVELLASAGREVVFTKRTLLVPADEPAMAFYVALTGRLSVLRGGQPVPGDPIREFYGASSMLGDAVLAADVVAEPGSVLFVLDRDAFFAVLEEHGAFQRSLLRIMSGRVLELRKGEVVTSGAAIGDDAPDFQASDLLSRCAYFGMRSGSTRAACRSWLSWFGQHVFARRLRVGPFGMPARAVANVVIVVRGSFDVVAKAWCNRVARHSAWGSRRPSLACPWLRRQWPPERPRPLN